MDFLPIVKQMPQFFKKGVFFLRFLSLSLSLSQHKHPPSCSTLHLYSSVFFKLKNLDTKPSKPIKPICGTCFFTAIIRKDQKNDHMTLLSSPSFLKFYIANKHNEALDIRGRQDFMTFLVQQKEDREWQVGEQ